MPPAPSGERISYGPRRVPLTSPPISTREDIPSPWRCQLEKTTGGSPLPASSAGYKLTPNMDDLIIEAIVNGDEPVIHCKGRLVAEQAPRLRAQVKPLIPNSRKITLDLTELAYMDSSGLGVVASLYVSARTAGCQFEVINLSRRVRDLLKTTHLLALLEVASKSTILP